MWLRHRLPARRTCRSPGRWSSHHHGRRNVAGRTARHRAVRRGRAQPGPQVSTELPTTRVSTGRHDGARRGQAGGGAMASCTPYPGAPARSVHASRRPGAGRACPRARGRPVPTHPSGRLLSTGPRADVGGPRARRRVWRCHQRRVRRARPGCGSRPRRGRRWPLHFVVEGDLHLVLDGRVPAPHGQDATAAMTTGSASRRHSSPSAPRRGLLDAITVGSVLLHRLALDLGLARGDPARGEVAARRA